MKTTNTVSAGRQRAANAEYKRLSQCLDGLPDNRRTAFDKLLHEAAFVSASLEELRGVISVEGLTETYQNGATQYGKKVSTAVTTYDKLLNTYIKVINQISRGLPENYVSEETERLNEFIADGFKMRGLEVPSPLRKKLK